MKSGAVRISTSYLALEGRRMLVTGASSGIGRSVAIEASKYGANVALLGRRRYALDETMSQLHGDGHHLVEYDLENLDGISAMVRDVADHLEGIDVVVHSAGLHSALPLKAIRALDTERVLNANVASAVMLAKGFRQRQVSKVAPSLVFLSSAAGLVGQPGVSLYAASKGAIISLTKSLAVELVREGIRVNCVCPGVVTTEMTQGISEKLGKENFDMVKAAHPLGLGEPRDVANAVLYLSSNVSRWVTGSTLVVDGGFTAQ